MKAAHSDRLMNMVYVDFQLSIPSDLLLLLRQMGDESERRKANLWIVGGSVRDALIGKPILDIDLVSETPAHTLGPQLARAVNGTATDPTIFGACLLYTSPRPRDRG